MKKKREFFKQNSLRTSCAKTATKKLGKKKRAKEPHWLFEKKFFLQNYCLRAPKNQNKKQAKKLLAWGSCQAGQKKACSVDKGTDKQKKAKKTNRCR
jgi:hypothetical protein